MISKELFKKNPTRTVKEAHSLDVGDQKPPPEQTKAVQDIWQKAKLKAWKWRGILVSAPSMAVLALAGTMGGLFQNLEWTFYDSFTRWRPAESLDPRIVVVTIDEPDLRNYNFPIPDQQLAQALENIKQQQPRAIGLDIYRDLPQEPGHQELVQQFETTDNLIGVEKINGEQVAPPHTLLPEQVAMSDLVLDADGRVRRALLSVEREDGQIQLGLGVQSALTYLAYDGIYLESTDSSSFNYQLGRATIRPFGPNDGGYVRADAGGYQVLLNYRGVENKFQTYSFTDVVEGKTPENWARDRIVFIGSSAESLNDRFFTPYSANFGNTPQSAPGVVIHANIASQLLSAALEGRQLTKVVPEPIEWGWLLFWCVIGSGISWQLLKQEPRRRNLLSLANLGIFSIVIPGGFLVGFSYIVFLHGWWVPVATPLIGLTLSALIVPHYKNYELSRIASVDGLTQIANRRHFDEQYEILWDSLKHSEKPISIIICDVDYFKLYNDSYGHQAGDKCLYQVAQAISKAIRSTDLVARYGGEEFVIILPDTDRETALKVGERVCSHVRALHIPHDKSQASHIVTLSCGVATAHPHKGANPGVLVACADRSLYTAKGKGRNCVMSI